MKLEYYPCKKCGKLTIKTSIQDGYWSYKKGFVGRAVRIYHPKKEKMLIPVCSECGFDNSKPLKIKQRELLFKELVYKL